MLPAPRSDGDYLIAVVCSGNICRSPVADVVLSARLAEAGLDEQVRVESFGLGDWHVGDPMDRRSAASLSTGGYDGSRHRARQFGAAHVAAYDLVLAMDRGHLRDLRAQGVDGDRLRLFREFDPSPADGEVPDPYYGGAAGFAEVLDLVERTADALVAELRTLLGAGSRS